MPRMDALQKEVLSFFKLLAAVLLVAQSGLAQLWGAARIPGVEERFGDPFAKFNRLGFRPVGAVVEVDTGSAFVTALSNASVEVVVLMRSIVLTEADFVSTSVPFIAAHTYNVTVMGPYNYTEPAQWPSLDLSYLRGKIRVPASRVLRFLYMVLLRARSDYEVPGLDIIHESSGNETYGVPVAVTVAAAYLVQRVCVPPAVLNATLLSFPRPPHTGRTLVPTTYQVGTFADCTNSTTVPVAQRCYPARGMFNDYALWGTTRNTTGGLVTSNRYAFWLFQVAFKCERVMEAQCVADYGLTGCYARMFPTLRTTGPSVTSTPAPRDATPVASGSTPTTEVPTAGVATSGGSGSGDSNAGGSTAGGGDSSGVTDGSGSGGSSGGTDGTGVSGGSTDSYGGNAGGSGTGTSTGSGGDGSSVRDQASGGGSSGGGSSGGGSSSAGRGGGGGAPMLARVLPAVLGGLALVGAVAGVAVFMRHRRRRARSTPYKDMESSAGGASGGGDLKQYHQMASSGLAGLDGVPTSPSLGVSVTPLTPEPQPKHRGAAGSVGSSEPGSTLYSSALATSHLTSKHTGSVDLSDTADLVAQPLTPATPLHPDVPLDVRPLLGEGAAAQEGGGGGGAGGRAELRLTGITLGRGSFGRVVEGLYGGQRVAVKMLDTGLLLAALRSGSAAASLVPAAALSAPDALQAAAQSGEEAQRAALVAALAQEVEVLARCSHANIVRLLAANLSPPTPLLVMERCDTSLAALLRGAGGGVGLPLGKALHLGLQIARALAYLHPTVLHRDIKPANVLVCAPFSERPTAKLADFGLARLRCTVLITQNPEVGTAPYMAPETFDVALNAVTDRSDIYSLGVLLWEMLTGLEPWKGHSLLAIATRVTLKGRRLPAEPLKERGVPPKLVRLIGACFEAEPARRPAAAEVVKTLLLVREELERGQAQGGVSDCAPSPTAAERPS